MPLILRDRLGVFSLFPLAVVNLIVPAVFLAAYPFEPLLSIIGAWAYLYVLLLQTRLMALLLVSGWVTTPILGYLTDAFTVGLAIHSMGIFTIAVLLAHLVAFGISAITGFRI